MMLTRREQHGDIIKLTAATTHHCSNLTEAATGCNTNSMSRTDEQSLVRVNEEKGTYDDAITAASQVFCTLELLEFILLHVPPRDLLCYATLVCYQWHAVIGACAPIQRALFFLPQKEEMDSDSEDEDVDSVKFTVNPFLLRHLARNSDALNNDTECCYNLGPRREGLDGSFSSAEIDAGKDDDIDDLEADVVMEFDWAKVRSNEVFGRADASWRWMLAVQPLVPEVWYVRREVGYWGAAPEHRRDINRPLGEGKRVGGLWETVEALERDPRTLRTRTMIRRSARYGFMVVINVLREDAEEGWVSLYEEEIPRKYFSATSSDDELDSKS